LRYDLHLFLSIVFLVLLLRLFPIAPPYFDLALFSCVSLPAMYALSYYRARLAKRFVKARSLEYEVRELSYEAVALVMSYATGLAVYVALYGVADIGTYTVAYIIVQGMRCFVSWMCRNLSNAGIDVARPSVVLLVAGTTATIFFGILYLLTSFL